MQCIIKGEVKEVTCPWWTGGHWWPGLLPLPHLTGLSCLCLTREPEPASASPGLRNRASEPHITSIAKSLNAPQKDKIESQIDEMIMHFMIKIF